MRLEELVIRPTREQQQVIDLRKRLGALELRSIDAAARAQAARRTADRRGEQIAELEPQLLALRTERGGMRLVLSQVLDAATLREIDRRYAELQAEEARWASTASKEES